MGSVIIKESVERVGEASISTIEYEFSDSVDFLAWESDKQERLTNALKSFVGGLDPMDSVNYMDEPMVAEVKVKKKTTQH